MEHWMFFFLSGSQLMDKLNTDAELSSVVDECITVSLALYGLGCSLHTCMHTHAPIFIGPENIL